MFYVDRVRKVELLTSHRILSYAVHTHPDRQEVDKLKEKPVALLCRGTFNYFIHSNCLCFEGSITARHH